MDKKHNYWITYNDGTKFTFYAKSEKEASWYFHMEGDHAVNYGKIDNTKDKKIAKKRKHK